MTTPTPPPRTKEQITADIEMERQRLVGAVDELRSGAGGVATKAKRAIPVVAAVVALGGFLATSAFLATLRFVWRRFRG